MSIRIGMKKRLRYVLCTLTLFIRECLPWCSIFGVTVTVHQFFCILHFWHTCFPLPCGADSTVTREEFNSSVIMPFSLVCCACDNSYIVSVHIQSQASIYTLSLCLGQFLAGATSQAGDTDSSWAPGLTSGLQGSTNVHRGALLLVSQWQYISSYVFYLFVNCIQGPARDLLERGIDDVMCMRLAQTSDIQRFDSFANVAFRQRSRQRLSPKDPGKLFCI